MCLVIIFIFFLFGMSSKKDENIFFCFEEECYVYEVRLNYVDKEDYFENRDLFFEKNVVGESEC